MSAPARLTDFLRAHGWHDAGRDCWCKYQGMESSLVVRWLTTADLAQLTRLRGECVELLQALDLVLGQTIHLNSIPFEPRPNQQGSLF